MAEDTTKEELESMVTTNAWKYLVKKMKEKQEDWKNLVVDTHPLGDKNVGNILKYQAMITAVDALFEEVTDILKSPIEEGG